MTTYSKGREAEKKAKEIYIQKGYTLLEQNWRYYSNGRGQKAEVDLIAFYKNILIFCEVKYRTSNFIPIQESITKRKITLLKLAAQAYVSQHPEFAQSNIRFDAIFIYREGIEILENIG